MSVSYTESRASRILRDCLLAAQSSLSDWVSEGVRRRIPGDSVAEIGHFEAPESASLGWRVTACLAGSHKIETFSGERSTLRREFLIFFDFLARTVSAVPHHKADCYPGMTSGLPVIRSESETSFRQLRGSPPQFAVFPSKFRRQRTCQRTHRSENSTV